MQQPPDHDFYNSSTEDTPFTPPQRPGYPPPAGPSPYATQQAPRTYGPQNMPPNAQGFGPPAGFPPQPQSQPGFGPQGPGFNPASQPGFPPQSQPGGMMAAGWQPQSQPGFGPPQGTPGQGDWGPPSRQPTEYEQPDTVRRSSWPPPTIPISQPGFSQQGQQQMSPQGFQQQGGPGMVPTPGQAYQPYQPQQVPPPGGGLNQQPAPAQKTGARWLIIVLVIVVILAVGGGGYWMLAGRHGSSGTPTPVVQGNGTPSTSGVTQVPTKAPTSAPSNAGFKPLKTPVQAGNDWLITITSVKETTASLIAPSGGNTYLEINFTLKNTATKTLTIASPLQFILVDSKARHYNESITDTNNHRPPDGNYNAGQSVNTMLSYQVPKSQHAFVFTFAYGLSDNTNATVSWRFAL